MQSILFLALFAAFTIRGQDQNVGFIIRGQDQNAVDSIPDGYKWDVTKWSAGCKQACLYSFTISGPASNKKYNIPAFTANCAADHEGGSFFPCKMQNPANDPNIAVNSFIERQNSGAKVTVSFRVRESKTDKPFFSYSRPFFNITGSATTILNQFVAPLQNFAITPTGFVEAS